MQSYTIHNSRKFTRLVIRAVRRDPVAQHDQNAAILADDFSHERTHVFAVASWRKRGKHSYRIVSYRIVSYRIVSYRIISYRIVT